MTIDADTDVICCETSMADAEAKNDTTGRRRERGILERPKGSGIWWAVLYDEHGHKRRKRCGPKRLAVQFRAKMQNQVFERVHFPGRFRPKNVLVSDAIEDYLVRKRGTLKSLVNWERYAKQWKETLAGKTLRQLVPGDVERYAARRRTQGLSDASVNRELTFLRSVINMAIADGKAETNPVLSRLFVKESNERVRYLTDEEEKSLREKVDDADWPKVAVAIHTGLRQGNLFQLRWSDVNFDAGVVRVPRSKSGEAYTVPMNDEVRAVLRDLPSRLRSEWVFPSRDGDTPLNPKNFLHRVFYPALEEAGIADFRWHDLRHTFASRLVLAGVDLPTVKELMGHKTLLMTLRYSHLSPQHRRDAVQRLVRRSAATDTTADTTPAPKTPAPRRPPKPLISRGEKVSRVGFEPTTLCLKGRCSAA